MKEKRPILITCFPRISKILAEEVESLGYKVLQQDPKNVRTEGTWEDVMRLNLYLRTANRVLWEIDAFNATTPDQLYDAVRQIRWHLLIPKNGYFSVQSFVKNDFIKDTRFANLKVKDAIVDYHYELLGKRPDSGPDYSKTVVFLHWINEKATIYFDTSGESIAKHGYRKDPWKAPMNESLAAATILQTGWNPTDQHFVNPMCGSGTLAIEAALMSANIPGNWNRANFGFMHIVGFNRLLWNNIRREARKNFKTPVNQIIATDISPKAVQIAERNAIEAGVADYITFNTCDFRETE
ncbi:MAG: class I SAM-dependent RNA methyltransferase, partial [Bacteroidota bacterium]